LNLRPSGYEPDELPDCSTPQQNLKLFHRIRLMNPDNFWQSRHLRDSILVA